MDAKQMEAAFARHWASFLEEVRATADTPEHREKIKKAVEAVLAANGDNRKATGLAAALAEHWEPFMANLLSGSNSKTKKEELISAFREMLLEQAKVFSRILSSS
jgi:heme oxygenase